MNEPGSRLTMRSSKSEADAVKYLGSLVELASAVAKDVFGVGDEQAMIYGEEVAARVSTEHRGQQFYIGAKTVYSSTKADDAIYAHWLALRRDYAETARTARVSTRHVYRVIKRVEARQRGERQGKLTLE